MKNMTLAILALSITSFAAPLHAQSHHKNLHEAHLKALDEDKNGGVNREEYSRFMEIAYNDLDKNHDNFLSKNELKGIVTDAQFAQMDKNSDGRISKEEYMKQVLSDFKTADRGNDGELK